MKQCTKCKQFKSLSLFSVDREKKSGLKSWCKTCDTERALKWNKENREKAYAYNSKWVQNNKEDKARRDREWQLKNPAKVNAIASKRKASKLQRTPSWLTEQDYKMIDSCYATAIFCARSLGEPYDVDHIIPLQGKTVSGLHVPNNLQVLPASVNRSKSNSFVGV